jgi:hypothetical protein
MRISYLTMTRTVGTASSTARYSAVPAAAKGSASVFGSVSPSRANSVSVSVTLPPLAAIRAEIADFNSAGYRWLNSLNALCRESLEWLAGKGAADAMVNNAVIRLIASPQRGTCCNKLSIRLQEGVGSAAARATAACNRERRKG